MRIFTLFLFLVPALWGCSSTDAAQSPETSSETRSAEESPQSKPDAADMARGTDMFIRGVTALEMGDIHESLELLLGARELTGPQAGIDYSLADNYLQLGDLTRAAEYGKKAVEAEPEEKWYRVKLANIFRRAGRNQDTIDQFKAIVEVHPGDIDILYNLARVQHDHGNYAESNRTYSRILDITGPDVTIFYYKYRNFSRLGQTPDAIGQMEKILEIDPSNIAAIQTLGEMYIEEERYEEAIEFYRQGLEFRPGEPELVIAIADAYIVQGKWIETAEILMTLIEDDKIEESSKIEVTQYLIGRYSRDPGNEDLAEAATNLVESLLENEPDFGFAHALAAEYYNMTDNEERLTKALLNTTRLMPENETAWRQLLQQLLINGDYDGVIEQGQEANDAIPDDAFIQFFVGNAYLMNDQHGLAIDWLERASDAPSRREFRSAIFGTLGDAYAAQKSWEDADASYEEALRLNADNDIVLNNYAYYLSTRSERLDEAKEMSQRSLEAEPQNAAYLDTLGWIYFKKGDYENARTWIQASIDTGDASATVYEHMGDVYEKLGEMDKAVEWWQKALEKDDSRDHLIDKISGA